jgi:hypothetical protein
MRAQWAKLRARVRLAALPFPAAVLGAGRRARWVGRVAATRLVPAAAFLLVIVLWAVPYLAMFLSGLRAFDPVLGDGPFQMFNPLRRIDAGQRGGADFQYFHGIGIPYLHYPIFALAGKTVTASEVSRVVVTFGLYLFAYPFVFACLTRRLVPTLALTAAALIIADQTLLLYLFYPANGTSGVRSVVPFLLFGVMLAGLRPVREAVILGAGSGVALLLGTEYGVATVITLGFVWAGRRWLGHPGGRLLPLVTGGAAFAATLAGLLLAIGGPAGAVKAMRYALLDLPADQFWYFGAPPQKFVRSVWDLPAQRELWVVAVGPAVALAAVVGGWMSRDRAARPLGVVLLAALAGGLVGGVGYLGYISIHYLQPLSRVAIAVGLVLTWHAWQWATTRAAFAPAAGRALRLGLAVLTGVAIVAGPTPHAPSSVADVRASARQVRETAELLRDGPVSLGPFVSRHVAEMTGAIDADRAARGVTRPPVIWNTYASAIESHYGVLHPATDYIIHAIGPTGRETYLEAFRRTRPDYVILCKPDMQFEAWLQHATWPFYEEVLLNYEPLLYGCAGVLWRRADAPWRSPDPTAGRVTRDPDSPEHFVVEPPPGYPRDTPMVVEVEYQIRNPLRRLPVIGALPRHLLVGTGLVHGTPVSLPPYRTSWTFPVFPLAGQTPVLYAGTFGPVGARVTITKVHVRPLLVDGRQKFLLNPGLIPRP